MAKLSLLAFYLLFVYEQLLLGLATSLR